MATPAEGVYYTRNGHFQIDAHTVGGQAGQRPTDLLNPEGPIALVTSEGYILQGVNAVLNPQTGEYALPAASGTPTIEDIVFDPTGILGPFATTSATIGFNLHKAENLAIDPVTMTMTNQGVEQTIRLEFQRAAFDSAAGESYYYFRATEPTPQTDGSYLPVDHSGAATPIEGVFRLNSQGRISGVFQKPAGDVNNFLDAAELAGLTAWTNSPVIQTLTHDAPGSANQAYYLGVLPAAAPPTVEISTDGVNWTTWSQVAAFTAAANEYLYDATSGRLTFGSNTDAPPSGATIRATYAADASRNIFTVGAAPTRQTNEAVELTTPTGTTPVTLAAPVAFVLDFVPDDPNNVQITHDGTALVRNVDYTVAGQTVTPVTAWSDGSVMVSYASGGNWISNEEHPVEVAAPPAITLARPYQAGSLVLVLNDRALVSGVDFNENPATGVITPIGSWETGLAAMTYRDAAGAQTFRENQRVSNPSAVNFEARNPPIDPGTITFNTTRGGNPLAEGVDFAVNYETGAIRPLTFWDPSAGLTMSYTEADTRAIVDFGRANQEIGFASANLAAPAVVGVTPRTEGEIKVGTAMTAYDNVGNGHSLSYAFERISENRWTWAATPTYRYNYDPGDGANATYADGTPFIADAATGGGTTRDGLRVLPDTLLANGDGTFKITLQIDEGSGPITWSQIPPAAAFPLTGDATNYFRVVDSVTGEIALSRDLLNIRPFSLPSYPAGTPAVASITVTDAAGAATTLVAGTDYNVSGRNIVPIVEWPNGTASVAWTVNGTAQNAFAVQTRFPTIAMTYPSNQPVGQGILAFDANGVYDATNSENLVSPITFPSAAAASQAPPGWVNRTLTAATTASIAPDFSGLRQTFRQSDVTVTSSNGFPAGELVSWNFDSEGRVVGQYANGKTQFLARVALANFTNPEGLQARGETTFLASAASGGPRLFFGGTMEATGTAMIPGALETSNVDMSTEMSNLIIFQRAYQFNSRIVTTTDEMIKEAIGMKR
jgi:flagellar hook-basal body protein